MLPPAKLSATRSQAVSLRFDQSYSEFLTLEDGTRVQVRPIRPDDKGQLREAWERVLPTSRYRRFLSAKDHLTDAELAYLTEVDGIDHFALVAGSLEPPRGLAVARFVRHRDRPNAAEAAIMVTDDAQGKGLGRQLLSRLAAAAQERGIDRFTCQVHRSNEPMLAFLRSIDPNLIRPGADGVIDLEIPLELEAEHPPATNGTKPVPVLYRLLSVFANGRLVLKHAANGDGSGASPPQAR